MDYAKMTDEGLYDLQDELWNKAARALTHAGYYTHREDLHELEMEMYRRKLILPRPEDTITCEPHYLRCGICSESLNEQCVDPGCRESIDHDSESLTCEDCDFRTGQE
jgi:hypothetical protein